MAKVQSIPQSTYEKARKLLALAERGVDGEKVNARRILDKFLKEHGLTYSDIGGIPATKNTETVRHYPKCPDWMLSEKDTVSVSCMRQLYELMAVQIGAALGMDAYYHPVTKELFLLCEAWLKPVFEHQLIKHAQGVLAAANKFFDYVDSNKLNSECNRELILSDYYS